MAFWEDVADVATGGGYTLATGRGAFTTPVENIYKTFSGEYERQRAQAQRESNAAQQQQTDIQAQKARISQEREARIRRAQVLASTGISGSSGTAGAMASISSQEASNIGSIGVMQDLSTAASNANQRAADASSNMALGQMYGQMAGTIFTNQGGFTTIFGGNTHKKAGT